MHQTDSGGICWLPALVFFLHDHDNVLSSRISVLSVHRMSNSKRQELDSNSQKTKDFCVCADHLKVIFGIQT